MKKSAIVMFFAAFISLSAFAQSIQEGVNHLYAQRYQSAKSVFEKLLATNPNNIEATYWLGQTYIAQKNIPAAHSLFEKALMASGNAPLLMVGMGNVELLEGKANEARSHFESAINASRGKKGNDPVVLNAIGRANVAAYSETNKLGDLDYAISKLTEAASLSSNNPDIYLNLGNAYRKKGNKGAEAIQAYRKAAQINPSFAIASYRAAQLYKTQISYRDPGSWGAVLDNLKSAIAADPKFAPAYEELYYYNLLAKGDFNSAEDFAKKYVSNSDPSVENDYLMVQTKIVQKQYDEAIKEAKNILAQTNNNAKPRVYRALAVASMKIKDTASACNYIDEFFKKVAGTDEEILGSDYIIHAQSCGRGKPDIVQADLQKAIMGDSVLSRQRKTISEWIEDAKANGQKAFEAQLRMMDYQLRKSKGATTVPIELISHGSIPLYLAGEYQAADSLANEYSKIAQDSIWGYYWGAQAEAAIDSSMSQGLAVENYKKALEIASTDTVRYKPQGVKSAQYLAIYFANMKNDYAAANEYADKGLKFDATNANLLNIKKVLSGTKQSPRSSSPQQKSSSSDNQAKEIKKKTGPVKTKVKKG